MIGSAAVSMYPAIKRKLASTRDKMIVAGFETAPDARGRVFDLTGWRRSFSIS